ncbi:hypothetical protein BC834DRAFT_160519 [Gloeopeniophorella convolvens]|nr:hypothetical protein BC834DRAFT_160519 [Gloeopeniophorella convolvens]
MCPLFYILYYHPIPPALLHSRMFNPLSHDTTEKLPNKVAFRIAIPAFFDRIRQGIRNRTVRKERVQPDDFMDKSRDVVWKLIHRPDVSPDDEKSILTQYLRLFETKQALDSLDRSQSSERLRLVKIYRELAGVVYANSKEKLDQYIDRDILRRFQQYRLEAARDAERAGASAALDSSDETQGAFTADSGSDGENKSQIVSLHLALARG